MAVVTISKALIAASATAISASQSGTAGVGLLINGTAALAGIATLDTQRRVLITSAGNDSGMTFAVTGTNEAGNVITETVAGVMAGAVATVNDFKTVTKIVPSANTASTVTVGTNTTGSTPWKNPSWHTTPFNLEVEMFPIGSVTWSLEYTLSKYWEPANTRLNLGFPVNVKATSITSAVAPATNNFGFPIRGWRLTVLSGTGTVTAEAVQAGLNN